MDVAYVIFGLLEVVGVFANLVKIGTSKAWEATLKILLNIQSNQFTKANNILILGHLDFSEELIHVSPETLIALNLSNAKIIVPKAVVDQLPENLKPNAIVMNNGELKDFEAFKIETIPMYNLREEALKFHDKGRGNGYVFTFGDQRIYFSGDTEDIPEMRDLKNIDKAFVCMNLPYTMPVENAANAVLKFKPKQVYPYHYRGTGGKSDVEKFKSIVNAGNPRRPHVWC